MAGPPTQKAAAKQALGTAAKIGITLGLLVAVAGGYYFFVYGDIVKAIAAQKGRVDQLKLDEETAQKSYKAYRDDVAVLEQKKLKSRDLARILPESGDMPTFLGAVNQQAEIAGLKVKVVAPSDESPEQYYLRVPIKLEVTGKFHQIVKFFAGVGKLDRIINIENIELTNPKSNDGDETIMTTKCLATTFRAKPLPAPDPNAPPPPGGG